jgi:hypothetical protein
MKTISLKLSDSLDRRIAKQARLFGMSKSQLVRDALESYLENGGKREGPSCHDLLRDLAGSIDAPPDLSTNPKYFENFGR